MTRRALSALLCAALIALCGYSGGQESSAPTSTPSIESLVARYADATVVEDEGDLIIGIRVDGSDLGAVCEAFFSQAEDVFPHCVSGGEYTGVSFSLVRGGRDVAAFLVWPGEGGMRMSDPIAYDADYAEAFSEAFYHSAFGRNLAE